MTEKKRFNINKFWPTWYEDIQNHKTQIEHLGNKNVDLTTIVTTILQGQELILASMLYVLEEISAKHKMERED